MAKSSTSTGIQPAHPQDPGLSKMAKEYRGPCLIINNKKFKSSRYRRRDGSEKDLQRFVELFNSLNFKVKSEKDLTEEKMKKALEDLAKDDETNKICDAVVIIIMSHGVEKGIVGKNNKILSYEDIVRYFSNKNCPLLKDKPKLFFFQACRGDKQSLAVEDGMQEPEGEPDRYFPDTSNVLLSFAAQAGFETLRIPGEGSICCYNLYKVLQKWSCTHELVEMLIEVECKVREAFANDYFVKNGERTDDKVNIYLSTSVKLLGWRTKFYFTTSSRLSSTSSEHKKQKLSEEPHVLSDETHETAVYRMKSSCKGPCLIIDNMKLRNDATKLEEVFTKLSFCVQHERNLTTDDITTILENLSQNNNTDGKCDDPSCAVIIIMSHGDKDGIIGRDRKRLNYNDVVEKLNNKNCRGLRRKPKLFFFQVDYGKQGAVEDTVQSDGGLLQQKHARKLLPETSDTLLSFGEGPIIGRGANRSSVYTSTLHKVLTEMADKHELMEILLTLEREVQDACRQAPGVSTQNDLDDSHYSTTVDLLGWEKKFYFCPTPQDIVE